MKSTIFISFDLSVRGDYEGMYMWLDRHKAKECGDNVAVLNYEYTHELLSDLKKELETSVDTSQKTRIYVIYRDSTTKKMKGKFIIGGRKASPWLGYAGELDEIDEGEA